jgi:hypothetical protein
MKFQPIDQGDDDDEADADLDWDAMAAKIAADGGSVVLPDDIKQKMLKKSKRQGDGDDKTAPAGDASAAAQEKAEVAKEKGEEPIEYDEHGKVNCLQAPLLFFSPLSLAFVLSYLPLLCLSSVRAHQSTPVHSHHPCIQHACTCVCMCTRVHVLHKCLPLANLRHAYRMCIRT